MRGLPLIVMLIAGGASRAAGSDFAFTECEACGIGPYVMAEGMGGGVAAADFDDDGDVDLFVPNTEGAPDQLYRNRGDGSFEEIAKAAGVASTERSRIGLFFDYDGDHRLDLFLRSHHGDRLGGRAPDRHRRAADDGRAHRRQGLCGRG